MATLGKTEEKERGHTFFRHKQRNGSKLYYLPLECLRESQPTEPFP